MYVTEHALERLAERTKVPPVDFISQMNYGKLVWIGQNFHAGKKFQFFLFYSDPDKDFFISVVNEKKNRVLSVWKTNFALPRGVAIGSRKKKHRTLARKNYREWFLQHRLKPIEVPVEILIEVVHGSKNKVEFSQIQERMLTCLPGSSQNSRLISYEKT
jgi:hypothetical protein